MELQVRALSLPNIGLTIAILFLVGYVVSTLESTFALWAGSTIGWGPRQVGIIFVFAGVVGVACQAFLVGPMARRFGEISVVEAASLLLALGMALVAASAGSGVIYLALALIGAGVGMGNPALQSLISQQSRQDRTGGALGLVQSTLSLARVVGPVCAGFPVRQRRHRLAVHCRGRDVGAGVAAQHPVEPTHGPGAPAGEPVAAPRARLVGAMQRRFRGDYGVVSASCMGALCGF